MGPTSFGVEGWRCGPETGDNQKNSQKTEGGGDTTASPPYKPMTEPETLLQHAAFLRGLARGLLGDADRAGDVVQQTWLAALEKGPRTPDKRV